MLAPTVLHSVWLILHHQHKGWGYKGCDRSCNQVIGVKGEITKALYHSVPYLTLCRKRATSKHKYLYSPPWLWRSCAGSGRTIYSNCLYSWKSEPFFALFCYFTFPGCQTVGCKWDASLLECQNLILKDLLQLSLLSTLSYLPPHVIFLLCAH